MTEWDSSLLVNKWNQCLQGVPAEKESCRTREIRAAKHRQQQVQRASSIRPCEDLQIREREMLYPGDH